MSSSARSEAIELDSRPSSTRAASSRTAATETQDEILLASQAADAAVPDGGYGWVVLGACSCLCFWFVGTNYSWGIMQVGRFASGFLR